MASQTLFYTFTPKDKNGEPFPLSSLKGKVVLIVNIATRCSFTRQLDELQYLQSSFDEVNPGQFQVLGFPCNQFLNQNPEDDAETQKFCTLNYDIDFPVLAKTDVNGLNAEPLYQWMKDQQSGIMGLTRVKWNFEKFLISGTGNVVMRWPSFTSPINFMSSIEAELQKQKLEKERLEKERLEKEKLEKEKLEEERLENERLEMEIAKEQLSNNTLTFGQLEMEIENETIAEELAQDLEDMKEQQELDEENMEEELAQNLEDMKEYQELELENMEEELAQDLEDMKEQQELDEENMEEELAQNLEDMKEQQELELENMREELAEFGIFI